MPSIPGVARATVLAAALTSLTSSLPAWADGGSTSASDDAPLRHHGFFFRPELGLGYLSMSENAGALGTVTVSGLSGMAGLALGGAVNNIVIAAHLYDSVAVNPQVSLSGTGQSGTSNATLASLGFGPEVDLYILPSNFYLSLTAGVSALSASVNNESVSAGAGFAGKLGVGKEWFAGDSWGLGMLLGLSFATNTDTGGQAISTWSLGLEFSATYNRFRDPESEHEVVPETAPSAPAAPAEAEVAAPGPTKDLAMCGHAYDHILELVAVWAEWNPDRTPLVGKPTRRDFLGVCGDFPPDAQECLVMPYGKSHRTECAPSIDGLSRTQRYRLDALFFTPRSATPAEPAAPSDGVPTTPQ